METYKLSDLCEILDSKRKPLSALQRAKNKEFILIMEHKE